MHLEDVPVRAKAYRVTPDGKFEPLRLELVVVGFWCVIGSLLWWGGYKLVMWMLG